VVRQFEMTGAWCLNRAASIGAARDKLHALQVMARKGVAMPVTAFAKSPKDTDHVLGVVGGAPLVVKLLQGSQGRGVVLAETAHDVRTCIVAGEGFPNVEWHGIILLLMPRRFLFAAGLVLRHHAIFWFLKLQ